MAVTFLTNEDKNVLDEQITELISKTKEANYVLIDRIPIGYEFMNDKPTDWEENWGNYFYIDNFWRIRTIESGHETAPSWSASKFLRYTGEVVNRINMTKEPDDTPYNFSSVVVFEHLGYDDTIAMLSCNYFYSSNGKISGAAQTTIPKGPAPNGYQRHIVFHIRRMSDDTYDSYISNSQQGAPAEMYKNPGSDHSSALASFTQNGPITRFLTYLYPEDRLNFPEGSYIEIWGVRV